MSTTIDSSHKIKDLSDASTKIYENANLMLITWLLENKPHLITKEYKKEVEKHAADEEKYIKQTIFRNLKVPPLVFSEFTGHDFTEWMLSRKNENGKLFGKSCYENYRSALYHLYKNYNQKFSSEMKPIIIDFFHTFKEDEDDTTALKRHKTPTRKSKKRKTTPTEDEMKGDMIKRVKENAQSVILLPPSKKDLYAYWKERLGYSMEHDQFKEMWKRLKKDVLDHVHEYNIK